MSGCTSDIDTVQDIRLKGYENFTIGQSFNAREICSNVKWDEYVDKFERRIVEYSCELKGFKDYEIGMLKPQIKKLKFYIKLTRSDRSRGDLKQLEADLKKIEQRIKDIESSDSFATEIFTWVIDDNQAPIFDSAKIQVNSTSLKGLSEDVYSSQILNSVVENIFNERLTSFSQYNTLFGVPVLKRVKLVETPDWSIPEIK